MNSQLSPQQKPNRTAMLVRSINLTMMLFVLAGVFAKLYSVAAQNAKAVSKLDDINPEALSGPLLLASGLLPILTVVGFVAIAGLMIWRYKIKG
jgi:nitrate reductase NapE component